MSAVAWFAGALEAASRLRGFWFLALLLAWMVGLASTTQALTVLVLMMVISVVVGVGRRVGARVAR